MHRLVGASLGTSSAAVLSFVLGAVILSLDSELGDGIGLLGGVDVGDVLLWIAAISLVASILWVVVLLRPQQGVGVEADRWQAWIGLLVGIVMLVIVSFVYFMLVIRPGWRGPYA